MSLPVGLDRALQAVGGPDPHIPASELAAMDPAQLQLAADRFVAIAHALGNGCTTGRQAIGQLIKGWSATEPRAGLGRLLATAEQTAAMLLAQGAAVHGTCVVIERARADARQDVLLAEAQINASRPHSAGDLLGAVAGVPQVGDMARRAAIVRDLHMSLLGRLATVELAVESLRSVLSNDPTVGPDGLRGGPQALLPPDPMMNPAHRTDQHNREQLTADLHGTDPVRMKFAMSIVQSLRQAGDRAGTAQLVVYDPGAFSGQGRAAISMGELTSATDVAVVVPGITNSPSAMSGGIQLAGDLRDEAHRQAPAGKTAVIAWYGYDIPLSWGKDPGSEVATDVLDTLAVGTAANSANGAPLLAADLQAIKSMSQVSTRTTVLGFSMGSTTVSEAARYELPVDSIVLMGSPGAGWDTTTAGGYRNVPAEDVYVLSYDQDPVTLPVTDQMAAEVSGVADPYGPDPAAVTFGGNHIDAGTNVPLVTGTGLLPSVAKILGDPRHHSMKNYMQGGALIAEAAIVVGRTTSVRTKRGR